MFARNVWHRVWMRHSACTPVMSATDNTCPHNAVQSRSTPQLPKGCFRSQSSCAWVCSVYCAAPTTVCMSSDTVRASPLNSRIAAHFGDHSALVVSGVKQRVAASLVLRETLRDDFENNEHCRTVGGIRRPHTSHTRPCMGIWAVSLGHSHYPLCFHG
jgi:hypothetical protein